MTTPLAAPAWILAGRLRNVPGLLVADRGRLEFHTGSGPAFAAPIGEVGPVTWPWTSEECRVGKECRSRWSAYH